MLRKIAIGIWAFVILAGLGAYLLRPDLFTPQNIASLLREFEREALLIYLVFSVFRGFTLLPSTPLVIAGTLLFPFEPWLVLATALFGIVASSSMIYWFSDLLGFGAFFESRRPAAVNKIRARLERPTGVFFVILWSFFPLVPTDAVCYVAGSTRMHFPKFIAAVFFGELILCSIYIFSGSYFLAN